VHSGDFEEGMTFRRYRSMLSLALLGVVLAGCATHGAIENDSVLIDGAEGLENFQRVGGADWKAADGAIQASQSSSTYAYLVSKAKYGNFRLKVEFWASDDANSGVFLRCQDPQNITAENCYEANIFDQRPDPSYGTGAIVLVAKAPVPMPKAGGRWNTYDITLNGARLKLVLNGVTTVDIEDGKLASGHIALQWGGGTIKFRKVEIQPL
jgi:hypothetical protein